VGALPPEADEEMARAAAEAGAPLFRLGRDLAPPEAPLGLPGAHQASNAALAVALAARAWARLRSGPLPPEAVRAGVAGVRWPGRLERVASDVLLDCAHNVEAALALAAALPALAGGRPVALLVSVVRDKDAAGILAALAPAVAAVVATQSSNPRSLSAGALETLARPLAAKTKAAADPVVALELARRLVGHEGLVVVAGSIFLVGELRSHLLGEAVDATPLSDPL
jgi:dihydrofolate synthase/folylpolyglutamate synthase